MMVEMRRAMQRVNSRDLDVCMSIGGGVVIQCVRVRKWRCRIRLSVQHLNDGDKNW